ncbi:hypothetical protein CEUSTIGMA_g6518.t1 [Chlamydomonas eustigma]|uniref:HECT-type E3 ubiquitin transferase n=1 Tax=Chlamydomonas eustigma TaxID=1157962 RepID=A0A250X7M0_9CHLO|nr:hypothetical protein CEUSTIGMA_g6518.t1 [Chlamydomonas eustigma]|eukprot:GAX79078.1 hypothetical protein CEUSTIGMA_g6518.t1 [Chlamydomonas eustigma]
MGGCVSSEEEPKLQNNVNVQHISSEPEPCAEDQQASGSLAGTSSRIIVDFSSAPSSGKQQSVRNNQVAPEPIRTSDSTLVKDQQIGLSVTSVNVPVRAPVETKWGLTAWETRECSPRAWPAFIQDLQQWSHAAKSDRSQMLGKASKMQGLLRQAAAWLDMAATTTPPVVPYTEIASMLEACSTAACELADAVLQPIVSHAERLLTHGEASSSSSRGTISVPGYSGTRWDTLEAGELLEALQASCQSEYGMELGSAMEPARAAAEMLLLLQSHSLDPRLRARRQDCVVTSINSVVSMLGIVFFRRVVLEDESSLRSKVEQLEEVLTSMGWPKGDSQLLSACLEPHAKAMLAGLHQAAQSGGELRVNFQVHRSNGTAFWEALQQATEADLLSDQAVMKPRCCKVFPSFVEEWSSSTSSGRAAGQGGTSSHHPKVSVEAGEGHGPRKEFFSLMAACMTGQPQGHDLHLLPSSNSASPNAHHTNTSSSQPSLLVYNRSAGAYWYNTALQQTSELQSAFKFAGWLIGQSFLNKAPLGISLAPALLHQVLLPGGLAAYRPGLEALEQFDPEAAASIRSVANLPRDQLKAMMAVEGLPGSTTAEQYIAHAVRMLLVEAVEWQARSLAAGFSLTLDPKVLRSWSLDAEALAAVLDDGSGMNRSDIDIQKAFRVVMDQELTKEGAFLGEALWTVLSSWSLEKKKQFLVFVTGSSRLPLPGSELLKVEAPFVALGAAEHKAHLGMVPQAHTCDNLLEVPNYWEALLQVKGIKNASQIPKALTKELKDECIRILDDRLTLAVTCYSGYGLDQRSTGEED